VRQAEIETGFGAGSEGMSQVLGFLRSLGLTVQFLLLATVLYVVLVISTGRIQNNMISSRMIEGSLEIEQALARGVLLSVLGEEPVRDFLPVGLRQSLNVAMASQIDPDYINKVKIWGVDGKLVYDSAAPVHALGELEPAVARALKGETVIVQANDESPENIEDISLGTVVYEVYMPLMNSRGEIIAVGEIYCSVELLLARISTLLEDTDYIRVTSLLIGIAGLAVLVAFAQRRLAAQERSIEESLARSDELAARNRQLFNESERLRTQAAQISEALLTRIGSELHDGPIQLLSIAALYRSQLIHPEVDQPLAQKASELLDAALVDLRSISTGLVLPTLEGLDLDETLRLAVRTFRTECGTEVALNTNHVDVALSEDVRVAIYRIVSEALHNARKHAEGRGVSVEAEIADDVLRITVSDKGPGIRSALAEDRPQPGVPLGLAGMRNRAKSIGARIDILSRPGRGTQVSLSIDLHDTAGGDTSQTSRDTDAPAPAPLSQPSLLALRGDH
jgi:signal transduction histidine kinase